MSGAGMNAAPDKLDEIIQEVAVRHGYVISRDDPVLMTYTINQQLMEASARIQRAVLEEHLRGMQEISKDLQDQAAGKLDGVLREAMESIRLALRQEAESLFSQQRRQSEAAKPPHDGELPAMAPFCNCGHRRVHPDALGGRNCSVDCWLTGQRDSFWLNPRGASIATALPSS